jgi:hypothetical protein
MIRIRNTAGELQELDESQRFVEICNVEGRVAAVVYADNIGVVKVVKASDHEFGRYKQMFGVKGVNKIQELA